MKIKNLSENIYAGDNNNKKNKRKYKHALSPFCSLNAGNVEKNIEMFNKANDTGSVPTSGAGMNGNSGGESMGESLNESLSEDTIYKLIDEYIDTLIWLEDK